MTLLSVVFSDSIGFPYDGNPHSPAQKRLVILKTKREFLNSYVHGKDSSKCVTNSTDDGFYIIR